jgi:hypothetical protein
MEPEHISTDNSEDEDATAMAAFMGFSAFGAQNPPTKKRKFNPSTDAFVEGEELEKMDRGGKKGMGSGGNTMPLGKARVMGKIMGRGGGNEDEIELDDDDDDDDGPRYINTSLSPPAEAGLRGGNSGDMGDGDGPRYMNISLPAPADVGNERGEDDGPAYVDTSERSPAEAAEMQARIDSILARIAPDPEAPEDDVDAPLDDTATESSPFPPLPHGLPQRPAFTASSDTEFMQGGSRGRSFSNATSNSSRGGRGRGRGGGGGWERVERNEKWYEGYYDPTFNENPWARLEKEKGLQSVGTWLENQRRGGNSRRDELKA